MLTGFIGHFQGVLAYRTNKGETGDLRYTAEDVKKYGVKNHPFVCIRAEQKRLEAWQAIHRTEVTVRHVGDIDEQLREDLKQSLSLIRRRWPLNE
jgi:hypothetical protein